MKGGFPGGLQSFMKQANQMQIKMKKIQDQMAQTEFEASAGGGVIKVKVNGDNKLTAVEIQQEVFKTADVEMLQDLILTATNEALKTAKETMNKEMEKVTGGMGIPGMF